MRCAVALLLLVACNSDRDPPERPSEEPPRSVQSDAASPPPSDAASAGVPDDARPTRAKLGLELRRAPTQQLAFGRGRLARIGEGTVFVLAVPEWSPTITVPLEEPRRVVALRDGSLVLVGRARLAALEHDEQSPTFAPAPSVFPGTQLFFDPRGARTFWALQLGALLYEYGLEPSDALVAPPLRNVAVEAAVGAGVGQLADGALLFTGDGALAHEYPGGKRRDLALRDAPSAPLRVLPADRIDRAWLVFEGSVAWLVSLGRSVRRVRELDLGRGAFDVAGGRVLAVLRTEPRDDGGLRWKLATFDTKGARLCEVGIGEPAAGTFGTAGWLEEETRERHLAVSPDGRWVAVGGPGTLTVHDARTGRVVHPAGADGP